METFSLKIAGVAVGLTVDDSGCTSDRVLGDAVYQFEGDLACEYAFGDGFALNRPGLLLASLAEYADAVGRGEAVDLETRAEFALASALAARVRDLAECNGTEHETYD